MSYPELSELYFNKNGDHYDNDRPEMLVSIPVGVKRLLDVGCSTGAFGKLIKEQRPGIEVWGIEPHEASAIKAEECLDRVIVGTFAAGMPELADQAFDCIVFNDVLEHLPVPERALSDSKRYLRPDGMVVASIPNILYFPVITKILTSQDWKYEEWGVMDNTHLRFFTKKSILRLFDDCGFDVVDVRGVNPCWGMKYNVANILSLNRLKDWRYQQFAVRAKLKIAETVSLA